MPSRKTTFFPGLYYDEASGENVSRMFRLLTSIYSAFYTLLLLLYAPLFLYRVATGRKHRIDFLQRAGLRPPHPQGDGPRWWIHAVSVGEVNAAKPLVDALALRPDQLWISTTTDTGQDLAAKLFEKRAQVFYFPFDWKWACRKYLRKLSPCAVLLIETEIWPGLLAAAESLSIPVILINGRISDASFRRYRRVRFFLRLALQRVRHFCMQSRQDKERILELGAPPERVNQTGNLKYDYALHPDPEKQELVETLGRRLKSEPGDLLWVCGSTREGEEEILLESFSLLRKDFPNLTLLLAPRHPHRVPAIEKLLQSYGFSYGKRSELKVFPSQPGAANAGACRFDILILDSIGEMAYLYQLGDVVFVGGSLVPTGGHNLIEAAYFGKPILVGPHMENFREIATTFLQSYACLQVTSGGELTARLRELLKDPTARNWLGRNARKVIRENQGAVRRTLEIVEKYR